jgi:hypothetical protein
MSRRPSLTEAGITRPSHALPQPVAATAVETGKRSPARQGKKAVAFWVDPGVSTQLRMAGLTMGKSLQDIMTEAVDDWFRKHRLPRLAVVGSDRDE